MYKRVKKKKRPQINDKLKIYRQHDREYTQKMVKNSNLKPDLSLALLQVFICISPVANHSYIHVFLQYIWKCGDGVCIFIRFTHVSGYNELLAYFLSSRPLIRSFLSVCFSVDWNSSLTYRLKAMVPKLL